MGATVVRREQEKKETRVHHRKFRTMDRRVSPLSFGCTPPPVIGDNLGEIDESWADEVIHCAIDQSSTYLDTTCPHHVANSEHFLGP